MMGPGELLKVCPECKGTGEVFEVKCPYCGGSGVDPEPKDGWSKNVDK